MMKSLTLILTLLFAADISVNYVYAQLDIKQVLETLKQQLHNRDDHDQLEHVRDRDDDKKDDDDDDDNRFGSLRYQEIEKLIRQALNNNNDKSNKREISSNKRQKYSADDQVSDNANIYSLWQAMNNKQDDDEDDDGTLDRLFGLQTNEQKQKKKKKNVRNIQQTYIEQLNQLLQDQVNKPKHNSRKKRLQPNDLLGDTYYPDVANRADPSDLNDYSKVYVILNVDAIQESKNPNQLNDILSTLLKSSSSQRDGHGRKDRRYKGFRILSDSARRGSRDSGEGAFVKDSELDYKPKRSRGRNNGDHSGRTPIPYIRHRGDIYEKDT